MLYRLRELLTKQDRKNVLYLFGFSIFISIVEVVGVTAIMPFVSLASDFSLVETNIYFSALYDYFAFNDPLFFVIVIGIGLILFYFFRSILNMYYVYRLANFSEGQYFNLANEIYSKNIYMKNIFFARQNTATLTKTIITEANLLTQVITATLFMLSEIFIFLLLCLILLYMNWKATLILFSVLFFVVIMILRKVTKLIKDEGAEREVSQNNLYKLVSSSFGNFKLIKLFGVEKEMMKGFSEITQKYVKSNIVFLTFSHIPRLILDALGFSILILIVLILLYINKGDIHGFLPILTLYVVSLYRMLPSLNRIVSNYNKITFYKQSLETIENELQIKKEELPEGTIAFENNIIFENITFSYNKKNILNNLSVTFNKGKKVALVGESGSGKSTFLDILMGLNTPSMGKIMIDNSVLDDETKLPWRKKIGYIPQDIYLFEGSVADNVVFGRTYDKEQIEMVLKQAHIFDFLKEKDGIETDVGEGGKLLSGGQKQRIAIARALYGNPEVLILDEATSALDKYTEEQIMKEIYDLNNNITLFIITHNPKITYGCDDIYRIIDGKFFKDLTK